MGDVVFVNGFSVYGVVFESVWARKEHRRNLKEAKRRLDAGNRGRNWSPHNTIRMGMWKMQTGRSFRAVEVMELVVISHS